MIGKQLITLGGVTLVASLAVGLVPGTAGAVDQTDKNGCTSPQAYSGAITSPIFDAPASPTISFQAWFEIEGVAPTGFDLTTLEYKVGAGEWTSAGSLNLADSDTSGAGGDSSDQPVSNLGPRVAPNWEGYSQADFPDLAAGIAGQSNVQLRFQFNTGDTTYQGFRGVGLDSILIGTSSTPLAQGFENGLQGWTIDDLDGVSGSGIPDWRILADPQTISVKNPEINPSLVTLPDSGALPPAFAGSNVAWFGDPGTGTFCGPDYANRFQFVFPPPPPPPAPRTLADLPNPALGSSVNVQQIAGTVLVGVRGVAARGRATASQKGVTFVPLSEARQIPVGSFLDTRRGAVRLQSARDRRGTRQNGDFSRGLFQVLQSRRSRGLTDVVLKGASFSSCRRAGRGKRARAAASIRRRLRGNARGRFRTRGRHSAATIRGTVWEVADRCDGTLTKVTRGKVAVRDFRRRKTVIVRAGKSYLARARR